MPLLAALIALWLYVAAFAQTDATGTIPDPIALDEMYFPLLAKSIPAATPSRSQVLIGFFIGPGGRLREVAGLQLNDLQLTADGSGTTSVTGKRTKAIPSGQRNIPFDVITEHYLIGFSINRA